jgi:hypothetical protein
MARNLKEIVCSKWRLQFGSDVCQSLYSPKGTREYYASNA